MNRDEFVSKFKLGQRIRANGWAVGEYGVITGFGPTNFSVSIFIDEECHDINVFNYDDVMFCDSWQHYEEPKEKPIFDRSFIKTSSLEEWLDTIPVDETIEKSGSGTLFYKKENQMFFYGEEEPKIPGSNFVNMNNCGEGVFGKGCEHDLDFNKPIQLVGGINFGTCIHCGTSMADKIPSRREPKPKKLYAYSLIKLHDEYWKRSEVLYSSYEEAKAGTTFKVIWPAIPKNGYYEIEED